MIERAPHEELAALIGPAERILVFTGAGISTGSGIPDYRGPKGVWKTTKPVLYPDFMASHDARVEYWEFKLAGYPAIRDARPNAVHEACVRLEAAGKLEMLVTQNVDGLHGKAGTSPAKLVEIHGTDSEVQCRTCGRRDDPEAHYAAFEATREPPLCDCGGFLKPATISFGQSLVEEDLVRAFTAAHAADLVVSLGSTLSVHPAASVPLEAMHRGAPYAIVNRGATDHDGLPGVTLRLDGDVAEIFPPAVG